MEIRFLLAKISTLCSSQVASDMSTSTTSTKLMVKRVTFRTQKKKKRHKIKLIKKRNLLKTYK